MNTVSTATPRSDWAHELVLPTLFFAALGAMTWAVRGCAGAGGMNAHVAPGLTWGAAWWFLGRSRGDAPARRYTSGWILLALAAGFAIAGERGWMQWPHFFSRHLATNYGKGEYVPLSRAYGFLWFFIAGTAWAGLPACVLAWCGSGRPLRAWEWSLRLACGFGGGYLAWRLFAGHPRVFLPLYDSIQAKYLDFQANPNLAKLYRDNGSSLREVGFCLGFMLFEIGRKDWKNVKLVLTVGLLNGLGWAACQVWRFAPGAWPEATFNFGRCWEASAGASIGIAFGIAYYLVNRPESPRHQVTRPRADTSSILEREWLVGCLLLLAVGFTLFWPAPRDLRQPIGLLNSGPHFALGAICLVAGVGCGGIAVYRYRRARASSARDAARCAVSLANWQRWGELALILVLGWFIKTQMASTYGDGVADGALAGWFSPGSLYFAVALAYVAARLLWPRRHLPQVGAAESHAAVQDATRFGPDDDWLASYLGLTVVGLWCLSVGLFNGWHAPIYFGIAVAAFGIAYRQLAGSSHSAEPALRPSRSSSSPDPVLERWGIYLGLVYGLGLSLRKALKGGANLYVGNEDAWDNFFWSWVSLGMLACLVVGMVWLLTRPRPAGVPGQSATSPYAIIWLVLIAQNVLAQVVTGPLTGPRVSWNEFAFSIFYLVLFFLTVVIVLHYDSCRRFRPEARLSTS